MSIKSASTPKVMMKAVSRCHAETVARCHAEAVARCQAETDEEVAVVLCC